MIYFPWILSGVLMLGLGFLLYKQTTKDNFVLRRKIRETNGEHINNISTFNGIGVQFLDLTFYYKNPIPYDENREKQRISKYYEELADIENEKKNRLKEIESLPLSPKSKENEKNKADVHAYCRVLRVKKPFPWQESYTMSYAFLCILWIPIIPIGCYDMEKSPHQVEHQGSRYSKSVFSVRGTQPINIIELLSLYLIYWGGALAVVSSFLWIIHLF